MAARRRMEAVKAAALSLLLDAYQRRDKVGLIAFRESTATVALPPRSQWKLRLDGWRTCRAEDVRRSPKVYCAP